MFIVRAADPKIDDQSGAFSISHLNVHHSTKNVSKYRSTVQKNGWYGITYIYNYIIKIIKLINIKYDSWITVEWEGKISLKCEMHMLKIRKTKSNSVQNER
mgnify:CR=1 FL=1